MYISTDSYLFLLIDLIAHQRVVGCQIVLALFYYLKGVSLMKRFLLLKMLHQLHHPLRSELLLLLQPGTAILLLNLNLPPVLIGLLLLGPPLPIIVQHLQSLVLDILLALVLAVDQLIVDELVLLASQLESLHQQANTFR